MVEDVVDQSLFESHQTALQPPPVEESNPEQIAKKKKLIKLIIIVGSILLVLAVTMVVAAMYQQQSQASKIMVAPSPTPMIINSEKQIELDRVKAVVESANPDNLLIVPPQVDMKVAF